jgi:hypothetical protein
MPYRDREVISLIWRPGGYVDRLTEQYIRAAST